MTVVSRRGEYRLRGNLPAGRVRFTPKRLWTLHTRTCEKSHLHARQARKEGRSSPGPFRRNVRNLFGFLAVVVWIFFVILPTPRTSHNLPHDCRQAFAGACTQAKAALPSAAFVSRASPHCERTAFGDDHTADALSCSVVTLSERACNTQQLHFQCVRLIALAPPIRGPPASV